MFNTFTLLNQKLFTLRLKLQFSVLLNIEYLLLREIIQNLCILTQTLKKDELQKHENNLMQFLVKTNFLI